MKSADFPADRPLVATAADRRVLVPLVAMLTSLRRHSPNVDVVVLAVGLSPDDELLLQATVRGSGLTLRFVRLDPALLEHAHLKSSHLTRTSYAPLFLPEILPDNDRVIWLDVDTVVLADLVALWRQDLRSALVAAAPDDFISQEELEATGTTLGAYFNSGVMVMNLARWRSDGLAATARHLMGDPHLICEDQSVSNRLCRGKVLLLDRRWNFHASRFHEYPSALRPRVPAVVHYCGHRKPWLEPVAFQRLFMNFLPVGMRESVEQQMAKVPLLRRLELARRRFTGMLLGRPKHWKAFIRHAVLTWADFALRRLLRRNGLSSPGRAPGVAGAPLPGDAGKISAGAHLLEPRKQDADKAAHRIGSPLRDDAAFLDQRTAEPVADFRADVGGDRPHPEFELPAPGQVFVHRAIDFPARE